MPVSASAVFLLCWFSVLLSAHQHKHPSSSKSPKFGTLRPSLSLSSPAPSLFSASPPSEKEPSSPAFSSPLSSVISLAPQYATSPTLPSAPRLGNVSCLVDPSQVQCSHYHLPDQNITLDQLSVCNDYPMSVGCSIRSICLGSSSPIDQRKYCSPFSVLSSMCKTDTPSSKGCNDYSQLCSSSSVVIDCQQTGPIPGLPTSVQLNNWIRGWCSSGGMDGCEKCPVSTTPPSQLMNCNLLEVYSYMCKMMPDMDYCDVWVNLCQSIPSWSAVCPSANGDDPPIMYMFFHWGIKDYILLREWVPRTEWQYVCSCLFVFCLAILFQVVQILRTNFEVRLLTLQRRSFEVNDNPSDNELFKESIKESYWKTVFSLNLPRASLQLLEAFVGYILMLIVMNFNAGLFLSLLGGVFFGVLFLGNFRKVDVLTKSSCH